MVSELFLFVILLHAELFVPTAGKGFKAEGF